MVAFEPCLMGRSSLLSRSLLPHQLQRKSSGLEQLSISHSEATPTWQQYFVSLRHAAHYHGVHVVDMSRTVKFRIRAVGPDRSSLHWLHQALRAVAMLC